MLANVQGELSLMYAVYFCSCTFTYVYVSMAATTAEGQNLLANISTSRASLLQGLPSTKYLSVAINLVS